MAHPANREKLPFRGAKTVVQCAAAGQLAGPRPLVNLEKASQTKNVRWATSDTPKKI